MNMLTPLAIILALVALLAAPAAESKQPDHAGKGKAKHAEKAHDSAVEDEAQRLFSQIERGIIAQYYRSQWDQANRSGTLPPGLAKRDRLPPGLQKQLVKNGRLPPGLDKRTLPNDLERLLGTAPKGTQRYQVGADIILVDMATNVLLDTVSNALYPPSHVNGWNN